MSNVKSQKFIRKFVIVAILFSIFYFPFSAQAFESTSATFELHAADIQSITGSSSSATFRSQSAGGQSAGGISAFTSKVYAGILYWFGGLFTARYEQIHYRWRNDNGTEVTATWVTNEDTQHISFPKNTIRRLRLEISNSGWTRGSAPALTLEVADTTTCSSGSYAAVPTTYGSAWVIATSTNITDGAATTNVASGLTDANNTFVVGETKDTGNTTSAIALTSSDFTEIEYGLIATDAATSGNTYCFRLTNNGATSGTGYAFTYTQYAQAVLASGLPATGSLDSAVLDTFDGGGASQGPAYNSVMWKGNINGSLGKVQFQLATSDCSNGSTNYPTCSTGSWTFYGSNGTTCNTSNYYDTTAPDTPVELSCSPAQHNNQRYFRYRVRLCSAGDCTSSGVASPIVDDVIVNWAP